MITQLIANYINKNIYFAHCSELQKIINNMKDKAEVINNISSKAVKINSGILVHTFKL